MTSPFEEFKAPTAAFDADCQQVIRLTNRCAAEDPELTIAFLMANVILIGVREQVPPRKLIEEFTKAIISFAQALREDLDQPAATEH